MFTDIKHAMDNPAVRKIIAHAAFDDSPESIAEIIRKYQSDINSNFYAWVENGKTLGICGYNVYSNRVWIRLISVNENARGRGVGSAMVTALQKLYGKDIEADTDDDAVNFYRKRGFAVYEFYDEIRGKRYACVLPVSR